MTKEDAIYEIKQLAVLSNEKNIERITKALEMAIEALHIDIVRCKECKWHDTCCRNIYEDWRDATPTDIEYCSHGEREDE